MSKSYTFAELLNDEEFMAEAAEAVRKGMADHATETGSPVTDAPMFRFTKAYTGEFWSAPKDEPAGRSAYAFPATA